MRKIFSIMLIMLAAMSLNAQDARQRTVETIVQDVLAQMPAQTQQDFNREMGYLAENAPKSIEMLAAMLQPAEKHSNNIVEYAISGVAAYASAHDNVKANVAQAFKNAIPSAVDATARQFLEEQLRLVSKPVAASYTKHEGTAPYAAFYSKLESLGENAGPEIVKAVSSKDHAYRAQALKFATENSLANEALAAKIAAKYPAVSNEARIDIVNWIGDNRIASQKPLLARIVKKGGEVAPSAIEALGRIGGDDARSLLVAQLGGADSEAAYKALCSFKGNIGDEVASALESATGKKQEELLRLSNARALKAASPKVFAIAAGTGSAAQAALDALPGVVTADDATHLADLLDGADADKAPAYEKALQRALASKDAKDKYQTICQMMAKASNKDRFYQLLASTNTNESVSDLETIYNQSKSAKALDALKKSQNIRAAAPLLAAAKAGDDSALESYINLVSQHQTDIDSRYFELAEALSIAKSKSLKSKAINSLGQIPSRNAFLLVGKYLDDADVSYEAANASKNIASKMMDDTIEYDALVKNLNRSISVFESTGNADDGYAIKELRKKLDGIQPPSAPYVLSDEEKKEGWELLFDGTNLDNFVGNKVGYVPVNGNIYVSAGYGDESNLYTAKEYRDFIFRFEFCFVRPGVNNGVGIRTPMGVDAAYYGMCESQILDHDDPIYANLRPYQVHGSVYGVIPAKRIKHKPLGEWSTEEIRVQGDHITVTVNGDVIVDGDIREACQGHNVAPDGSSNNPYTVDHRNHPGMFNERGHIGFLGHGEGLKLRAVRVLDLEKAQTEQASRSKKGRKSKKSK